MTATDVTAVSSDLKQENQICFIPTDTRVSCSRSTNQPKLGGTGTYIDLKTRSKMQSHNDHSDSTPPQSVMESPSSENARTYLVSRVTKILFKACVYNDSVFDQSSGETKSQLRERVYQVVTAALEMELTTEAGLVLTLVLLDRIQAAEDGVPLTSPEFDHMFNISCVLATKQLEDGITMGAHASRMFGEDTLTAELEILQIIKWKVHVTIAEYRKYANVVVGLPLSEQSSSEFEIFGSVNIAENGELSDTQTLRSSSRKRGREHVRSTPRDVLEKRGVDSSHSKKVVPTICGRANDDIVCSKGLKTGRQDICSQPRGIRSDHNDSTSTIVEGFRKSGVQTRSQVARRLGENVETVSGSNPRRYTRKGRPRRRRIMHVC